MFIRGAGPTLGPPKSTAAHRTVVLPNGIAEMLAAHSLRYLKASARRDAEIADAMDQRMRGEMDRRRTS